jgi:hypothetical protein
MNHDSASSIRLAQQVAAAGAGVLSAAGSRHLLLGCMRVDLLSAAYVQLGVMIA